MADSGTRHFLAGAFERLGRNRRENPESDHKRGVENSPQTRSQRPGFFAGAGKLGPGGRDAR